ncbi:SDR family NAD(P)-dependent oxidoreductase [Mycolicibacterium sp. 018/SC-01/001]|uniref:SDR family oxidoreductase n=1 Tax=Mycolicibacterium sp. 018/SC-01/001 TaxID=2592069 RepID=UPI00117EE328|nr:SDR family oxidoreductase [Mycolicibacterium sp. 018/SC-01/001]TRW82109.1 SDR family NAD(P)-dependent oxidoreductase [Mycolicibacterium sp. 018/SC-01/001]
MSDRPDVVVVTGASRGVGADVALKVARPGRHVVVNYREKERRAADVVASIHAAGGGATAMRADLCDEPAVAAMVDEASRLGDLKVLVLNASGGLERHADAGYARRLNRDAQVGVVRRALPLMSPGAVIVFVTSHPAHFFGRRPVPIAGYAGVAESKHAGEMALRELQGEFDARGITFVVVSGDLLEGSVALRLLHRVDPDAVAARRADGPLPTVAEFADAIAGAVDAPPPSGETVYVG